MHLGMIIAVGALAGSIGGSPSGVETTDAPARAEPGGGVRFRVTLPPARVAPATGRLVVYLIADAASIGERTPPAAAPFFADPQPMYGLDVKAWSPGEAIVVDDAAASGFPSPMADLPAGSYRAQAVLDMHRSSSSWHAEPGNLYSGAVQFVAAADGPTVTVPIMLSREAPSPPPPAVEGAEYFETPSARLSAFLGGPVVHRAGVALPLGHDPARSYAAIYAIPGFGGGRALALREARRRRGLEPGTPAHELASRTFFIALDPESGNGHHLFADSAVNGPRGAALVGELIPALEREYNLTASADARIVTGHSSGGWSSVWLALAHPEVFGACWSSAPDPVDFRAFQRVNIYGDASFYGRPSAGGEVVDHPSYTRDGRVTMTVREENLMEEVIGPGNTSGQQWDSWFAVFGPPNEAGEPAALFDPATGAIDHAVAGAYRGHDIGARLREEPERYGPIFRERVRLVVGSADSFDLHRAVELLRADLGRVFPKVTLETTPGYIEIIDGADHGSVLSSDRVKGWPGEMLEHLRRSGAAP